MATDIRCLVAVYKASEPVRDRIVNTIHFQKTIPDIITQPDMDAIAQDLTDLYAEYRVYPTGFNRVETRLYVLGDEIPRVPRSVKTEFVANPAGDGAPREVALCLSMYSEVNRPRNRGRLYIGPWSKSVLNERPTIAGAGTPGGDLEALADGLEAIGGVDIDWCIYSVRDAQMKKVTDWWVDDEWDTIRSRGLRGTTRRVGTTSE